jgi:hypothetical protein
MSTMKVRHAITAAVLALGAAFALACSDSASAHRSEAAASSVPAGAGAWELRQDMRKLWTDHVQWTRDYIVASVANQPDAPAAVSRLMRNQEDLGKAVGKYYGDAAGDQLTTLLKDHIQTAADVVTAAKANDKAGLKSASDRWEKNADQIVDFLSKANPQLSKGALSGLMKDHLKTTTDEVTARLKKDWEGDVHAYDAVYEHILKLSDALADAIVKQFPEKFE